MEHTVAITWDDFKDKTKTLFCHLKALMDHLNECLDYPIDTINSKTTVKVPWTKCFPTESMLKFSEVSINNYSTMNPSIFSQRTHSLKTIIKQRFACWVANNISFYPENQDFTRKET